MKKLNNKHGFASFVEVVVTAVIFTLAAVGIMASVSTLRPQGSASSDKLDAAYAAKGFLENLRTDVDATTWEDTSPANPISIGNHSVVHEGYTIDYTVTAVAGYAAEIAPRRVDVTVTY